MMSRSICILLALSVCSNSYALTAKEYLANVRSQNMLYRSSEQKMTGAKLQAREADLFFKPQFFFNAQKGYDSKLLNPPFLVFDQVRTERYGAGISQEFSFGVETKLSYELQKNEYKGIDFDTVKNPYWDAIPSLEINIPLWGNAFGRTSKARQELTRSQRNLERRSSEAQMRQLIVDAEIAYWRLAICQEAVAIQKKALASSENILSYVLGKRRKNLGDDADVLQARALSESYRLQLEQSNIDERMARRKYNFYIFKDADEAVEVLSSVDYAALLSLEVPDSRPGDRPDVRASLAQVEMARSNGKLAVEQNKPTLNVFGGYSYFGRGGHQGEAISRAGWADRDSAYFGLRYQMPLNISAQSDARKGAQLAQNAAELNHKYLQFSQEQEWIDLSRLMKDAQATLRLADLMEKAQKSKLDNERIRLRQGRTTTYQVLLFEQDYLSAELARIRAANQIINYKSQIQLYSSKD